MGRMNKITEKEKKLLLILLTLLILVGSYQFGYQRFHTKAVKLESENQELTGKLIELEQKQVKKQNMIDETTEYIEQTNAIFEQFPRTLTQEKNVIFVTELEKYAGIKIDSIAFNDMTLFYSPDIAADSSTDAGIESDATDSAQGLNSNKDSIDTISDTPAQESSTDEVTKDEADPSSINGYETTINLTYQSTYEGLKKAIDFINSYHEKRHVSDITASFDMTTGNLSGTISLVLYEVDGGANYEAPNLDSLGAGKDNIFGTFEN